MERKDGNNNNNTAGDNRKGQSKDGTDNAGAHTAESGGGGESGMDSGVDVS